MLRAEAELSDFTDLALAGVRGVGSGDLSLVSMYGRLIGDGICLEVLDVFAVENELSGNRPLEERLFFGITFARNLVGEEGWGKSLGGTGGGGASR